MSRVPVTGGSGFIGSRCSLLALGLLKAAGWGGRQVDRLGRRSSGRCSTCGVDSRVAGSS